MYIVIRKPAHLRHMHALKDKERILTRFVMNGCTWCHASQPDWDTMTKRMTPQLDDHDAIVEVERQFVDRFREFMARHRKPYPHIQSYPSVYVMSRGTASPHQGRDTDSFVQVLQQMKMLRDKEPHVQFMEKTPSPIKQIQLKSPLLKKSRKRTPTPLSFTVRRNTPRPRRSSRRSDSLGYTSRRRGTRVQ